MFESNFLDTKELAEFLNVSVKAIIKWRDAGRIPGSYKFGRVWRFRKNEIEKHLLTGRLLLPVNIAKAQTILS